MNKRLPTVSGQQVVRALERAGFEVIRVKGSHHFIRHRDNRSRQSVVPVLGSEDLGRALLRKILSDVGQTPDELIGFL